MFYTEKQLCELLDVDRSFLWSCRQKGLPFVRLGRKIIRYDFDEVIEWFSKNSNIEEESCNA